MIDRILQIIEYKGITKNKFYKETGLSNGFLDKVKDIGASKLEYILNTYPEINSHWLVTGKGEMLNSISIVKENTVKKKITDSYSLKVTDLGLLLTDNMKFLSFLVSILIENKYQLTKKEKSDIEFYRDLEKEFENIRSGKDVLNAEDFEKIQLLIRSNLFSFINDMIDKASQVLKLKNTFYFDNENM
ncbi:hypothetical protein [Chryseobacterium profundimaris]|uniref:Transcriptional regulator n=1 Tax=Chryseobacterium profundimaris TaxID=1387275 RepID=A0ABY1NG68_9FLAO|nr:hypothetical protein [Chryseobacterium profundimaris]SMP08857.1 hypothetical protein SAMN06264346_1024 [Chryseobacterium profundimaris]